MKKAEASTFQANRIAAAHQFVALKKLTIGPDDQYYAAVDPTGRKLVFTHKADLVAHLQMQDLASGLVMDLLPLTADSQEGSFSPNGTLAFRYFRYSARGDICIVKNAAGVKKTLSESEIQCIPRIPNATGDGDAELSNPFWVKPEEVGYSVRPIATESRKIMAYNLRTHRFRQLADGLIWSPTMKAGGHYLAYNELQKNSSGVRRGVTIKDLDSGAVKNVHFELPGISGFPAVSDDEKFIYFTHYLNDTNNDNAIDGSDNAVIFRLPITQAFAVREDEEIFPEQLTSVESSCSFPKAFHDQLFLTCAFEGGLDIYQVPDSGTVPSAWGKDLLENALRTSRSYQDRVLVLNSLRYRLKLSASAVDRQLLNNFILDDDTAAARYYLRHLSNIKDNGVGAQAGDAAFRKILGLYLDGRELKKSQPADEVSPEFDKAERAIIKQVSDVKGEQRFRTLISALLLSYLQDDVLSSAHSAASFLKVRYDETRPLESEFYFELMNQMAPPVSDANMEVRTRAYLPLFRDGHLGEEPQIYYAFEYLKDLQKVEGQAKPSGLAPYHNKRIATIERTRVGLPPSVDSLFQAEVLILKMSAEPDKAKKIALFRQLDQLMNQTKDDYFLRKAMYIRGIFNFLAAADFEFLDHMATNWLKYTAASDTEYIYAREVYSNSALDQGYDSFGKRDFVKAANFFYGSLALTDDLESHTGYIRSMILANKGQDLQMRYRNLKTIGGIDDNMKFVEALLLLVDTKTGAGSGSVVNFDKAIKNLVAMTEARDSAIRYLLLGYCYTRKLLLTAHGLEFDSTLFENADRSLMLAYDQGRDNLRVKASALINLGILHQRVQNHGLAVRFFALRKNIEFTSEAEKTAFEALYARSLYFNHQPGQAASELASLPPSQLGPELTERRAFYLTDQENFLEASRLYLRLLDSGAVKGDLNLAKILASYGYTLFRLGRSAEAQKILNRASQHAARLTLIAAGERRLIDFDPRRLQLIIYGLLGQIGTTAERISALRERERLLEGAEKILDQVLSTKLENHLWLAKLLMQTDRKAAAAEMKQVLTETIALGEQGQYLGSAVYHATFGYMAYGLLTHAASPGSELTDLVSKILKAYDGQKVVDSLLVSQKIKLQMIWAAYQARSGKQPSFVTSIKELATSSDAKQLALAAPSLAAQVQDLASALLPARD